VVPPKHRSSRPGRTSRTTALAAGRTTCVLLEDEIADPLEGVGGEGRACRIERRVEGEEPRPGSSGRTSSGRGRKRSAGPQRTGTATPPVRWT
jgi:hypothetical protein